MAELLTARRVKAAQVRLLPPGGIPLVVSKVHRELICSGRISSLLVPV